MKKVKYLYTLLAGILMLAAISCKKDFMDRYPQTSVPPDLFFNSEEDMASYINGLLTIPGRGSYVGDQGTDDKATTAAVEIKSMMTGTPSSQNITGGWSWGRLRNINYFLENYDKAKVSQEVKNHYAGLARFYRAQFYVDMVSRYSDVPWYSQTLNHTDSVNLYKPRDPRSLVTDSVMADLAFLQIAQQVAGEIISSGNYEIYNTGNPNTDYLTLFSIASLSGNKEVLLANIYDQDLNRSVNNNSNIIDYEQSPSRELLQTYLMKDGSPFTDQSGYQTFGFVKEFENRDTRLSQSFFYPGFILSSNSPNPLPYIQRLNKNFSGYHQLKGYINSTDQKILNGADFPAYRYSEVLLTYAEALAELGTITQADLDKSVNLLRNRAGLPALVLAVANANADPILAAQYPAVSGANRGVILEIRREKRVEFAMEGYRYDDLMRWGAG